MPTAFDNLRAIRVNAKYLIEAVKWCEGDASEKTVTLHVPVDNRAPMVVTGEQTDFGKCEVVIMPVRM